MTDQKTAPQVADSMSTEEAKRLARLKQEIPGAELSLHERALVTLLRAIETLEMRVKYPVPAVAREIERAIEAYHQQPRGGMRVGSPKITVTLDLSQAIGAVAHLTYKSPSDPTDG